MEGRKNEDSDRNDKERDLTAEMLEWAKDRIGSAPKTMPSGVEPVEPTKAKREATKLKQEPKVLVVALNEGATQDGQAHFFDDGEEASRFIETLMEGGLEAERIIVFHGTPMNVNVSYRPVVAIEQPEQDQPVAS